MIPTASSAEATDVDRQSSAKGVRQAPAAGRMIELMELAALRLMKSRLRDGESSVGIGMEVTHATSAAVRGTIRAVATYRSASGRMHRFTINAFDETGLIGTCEHTRAVVPEKRLLALARRGVGKPDRPLSV